ncbi:Uncharacterized protein HZ326_24264 [Fusarium oxysporum f. sp. albedinis]|nr:Uncharacterized protein HZ326_24264 [Fusarium oxysporum f. sp. albedinis]
MAPGQRYHTCEGSQDRKAKEAFETWWSTAAPEQHKILYLRVTTACLPELSLLYTVLHYLLAARSLYGDFTAYRKRFNHSKARLVCLCN